MIEERAPVEQSWSGEYMLMLISPYSFPIPFFLCLFQLGDELAVSDDEVRKKFWLRLVRVKLREKVLSNHFRISNLF